MVTTDGNTLFTSVPLLETIAISRQTMEGKNIHVGLPAEELERLLLPCAHTVKFSFLDERYQQLDGVAMGSHLEPILADIFVGYLEHQLRDEIKKLDLYCRYVDNVFIIYDAKERQGEII
ncbi:unnamed protein product [Echinostoma caproni]|uniref:Reverse transcriptase domain-containing protein n=1 Tax=Echinostoma caproni TaxID=27848 RepID=A0A183ADB7_9TREM|nr:unnamed protein product [Echinostoma caproni]